MTKPLSLTRMSKNVLSYYNQSLVPVRTTVGGFLPEVVPSKKQKRVRTHTDLSTPSLSPAPPFPSLLASILFSLFSLASLSERYSNIGG